MAIRSKTSGKATTRRTDWRARRCAVVAAACWLAVVLPRIAAANDAPALGAPAPNFALTTQQNDRLWLTQLRGRVVVLAFGCAVCGACPDLIPRLQTLARDLGDAPGRRVFFLLVTVDPARDTQAALREFGRAHGLRAPAWLLLTEDRPGQVEAVARRYGVTVRPAPGGPEADCVVTLVDGAGRIHARHALGGWAALDRDLRGLLSAAASP